MLLALVDYYISLLRMSVVLGLPLIPTSFTVPFSFFNSFAGIPCPFFLIMCRIVFVIIFNHTDDIRVHTSDIRVIDG